MCLSTKSITLLFVFSSLLFLDVNSEAPGCRPTSPDIVGPYYYPGAPKRQQICGKDPYYKQWDHLLVEGRVLAEDCRTPLPDTKIEVWQADHEGYYLFRTNCRGHFTTAPNGYYAFLTIHPGKYSIDRDGLMFRPAHIHFRISKPGYNVLITQLYFKGDSNLGVNDSCTACSSGQADLVVQPGLVCGDERPENCLHMATFNIVLESGSGVSVKMDDEDKPVEVYDAILEG